MTGRPSGGVGYAQNLLLYKISKCWLFSFLHCQSVTSVFEQTSDSPNIPPDASSKFQYVGFTQAGQDGKDLGQLVLR